MGQMKTLRQSPPPRTGRFHQSSRLWCLSQGGRDFFFLLGDCFHCRVQSLFATMFCKKNILSSHVTVFFFVEAFAVCYTHQSVPLFLFWFRLCGVMAYVHLLQIISSVPRGVRSLYALREGKCKNSGRVSLSSFPLYDDYDL